MNNTKIEISCRGGGGCGERFTFDTVGKHRAVKSSDYVSKEIAENCDGRVIKCTHCGKEHKIRVRIDYHLNY